ncbi:MAG: hypothetical protein MI745_09605 [Pseudomonadales bacterium]|nr:hypothetical protein [Pseudomonadales bacterium]
MSDKIYPHQVLRFLSENEDFTDELAKRLEIEADGGDSPGGYLREVVTLWRLEKRAANAHRQAKEAQEALDSYLSPQSNNKGNNS